MADSSLDPAAIGADNAVNGDIARAIYGVDGTGIKIGVISDSYNVLPGNPAAADIAGGELPASGVTVLDDSVTNGEDEGRAMLQAVHKVAPGAQLYFSGDRNLAASITNLVNAGVNIISMDIGTSFNTNWQDSTNTNSVQRAITYAISKGVSFFNAAGNYGRQYYEGNFTPTTTTINGIGQVTATTFGGGYGTLEPMQYDPAQQQRYQLNNINLTLYRQPGSTTNYTMYLLDSSGTVVAQSPAGSNTASRTLTYVVDPSKGLQNFNLVVTTATGAPSTEAIRVAVVDNTNGGDSSAGRFTGTNIGTGSGTLGPYMLVAGEDVIGGADYRDTPRYGAAVPLLTDFSSSGNGEVLYGANGVKLALPYTTGGVDFIAPTDYYTTNPNLDRHSNFANQSLFDGTSSASPIAAAVAGLTLQANTALNVYDLTHLLQDSSLDMKVSADAQGSGFIQADKAVGFAATGTITSFSGGATTLYGTHLGNTFVGGTASNTFVLEGGSNSVTGGGGVNTVSYLDLGGDRSQYSISMAGGTIRISSATLGTTDILSNVQDLQFSQGTLVASAATDNALGVAELYQGLLGRAPDAGGFNYWVSVADGGTSLQSIGDDFAGGAEFLGNYGQLSDADFLQSVSQNMLGRAADSSWLGAAQDMLAGGTSRAALVESFAQSSDYQTTGLAQLFANISSASA